jgi:hypothetical protein
MPTLDEPLSSAEETYTALRRLAHETRTVEDPAVIYPVIRELLGGIRAMEQIMDQLAAANVLHQATAADDNGNHLAGGRAAHTAALAMQDAGKLLGQVELRLDQASESSAQISWQPAAEPAKRWISVVFLQGEAADEVLDLIQKSGTDAAINHLAGYDYGDETTQAALENGYVYDAPPTGTLDRVVTQDAYTLAYSPFLGHVSLLRQYDESPEARPPHPVVGLEASRAARGVSEPTVDWFARSASPSGSAPTRGLSL